MNKISVQVWFSEKEYDELKERAKKIGLPVTLYIRSELFTGDEFNVAYQKLLRKVESLSSGTIFDIKMLFGVEWTMSKSVKLNLGRTYYRQIKAGQITNVLVRDDLRTEGGPMKYERK